MEAGGPGHPGETGRDPLSLSRRLLPAALLLSRRLPAAVLLLATFAVVLALPVLLWLLAAGGHGLPRRVEQAAVLFALVAGLAALSLGLARAWSRHRAAGDLLGLLLPLGLLGVSLLVRFAGLDWEIGAGYYRDEGIYRATAERINGGRLLVDSFVYGHLLHYAGAFALWLHSLCPKVAAALAHLVYGVEGEERVEWLALRSIAALCGALTTLPVYGIAHRIVVGGEDPGDRHAGCLAGHFAGSGAALLILFSPLYNEVAHLLISDVPAAFFATLCVYFAARLLDGENLRDALLAGVAAGLAAGSKYPAGVAAIAIAGVWACGLLGRLRDRRWSWTLLWAALASIAALLVVMPALVVYPRAAFAGQGRDILFGVRQYGEGGWIGVVPGSKTAWYGAQLRDNFGAPALLLGVLGILGLRRAQKLRLAILLPFPLAYLALLAAMSMVVKRNLQPVLPVLAALLGAGLAGAWLAATALLSKRLAPRPAALRPALGAWVSAALLTLAAVALPAWATFAQDLSMARLGTRELAVAWIRAHVPPGAAFVKESYTPNLDPAEYASIQKRFAVRLPLPQVRSPQNDYLLLAETAYGRFLDGENLTKPHHKLFAATYRQMLAFPLVQDFPGGKTRKGPHLILLKLDPERIAWETAHDFAAGEAAFLSAGVAAPRRTGGPIRFTAPGQFALFKGYFAAGTYRAEIDGLFDFHSGGGTIEARTRDGRELGTAPITADAGGGAADFTLPAEDKLFLYVRLPPGSRLRAVRVAAR